jgi:hypothetical protein
MNILFITLFFGLIFTGFSISLNQKSIEKNYCKSCSKCSLGYTGSGVLLYKKNNNCKNFVLGLDYKNELTDFGGKIDYTSEKIWNTASRELFEESNRVFNISGREILSNDYIDIDRNMHKYRCYILQIKDFDKSQFYHNKLDYKNSPFPYSEITNIIEIKEDNLKKLLFNKSDIPYTISLRLEKILQIYFESKEKNLG